MTLLSSLLPASPRAREFQIESNGHRRNTVVMVTHLPTGQVGLFLVRTWFAFEIDWHTRRRTLLEHCRTLQRLSDAIRGPRRWWPIKGHDVSDIFTPEQALQLSQEHLASIGTGDDFDPDVAHAIAATLHKPSQETT